MSKPAASRPLRAGLAVIVTIILTAAPATAQRLLSLLPPTEPAASLETIGSQRISWSAPVRVDLHLLRSAPAELVIPLPEGRIVRAQLSVFEDRGDGDLAWFGGESRDGHASVVLTVEDGHLVGRLDAGQGSAYRVYSRPDGEGRIVDPARAGGSASDGEPYCGVADENDPFPGSPGPGQLPSRAGYDLPSSPRQSGSPQSDDSLDILVLYTKTAAENWAARGAAPRAAIRNAGDYLNNALRYAGVDLLANIVHIAPAPERLDRVGRRPFAPDGSRVDLLEELIRDGEVFRLRHEHRADLVHLFTGEHRFELGYCGIAYLLWGGATSESFSPYGYGVTSNHFVERVAELDTTRFNCPDEGMVFAHEVGHNLGLHHDRPNAGSPDYLRAPYAYGYANFDRLPNLGTIMSYPGQETPYFSSVRFRPEGRIIGSSEQAENDRVLRESIQVGVRYSDSLIDLDGLPAQPTNVEVARIDDLRVRVRWQDNAPEADGYEVTWEGWLTGVAGERVLAEERTEAVVELAEPGGYAFWVEAYAGELRSLRSSVVSLTAPGWEPAAPSSVELGPASEAAPYEAGVEFGTIRWQDNSTNEWAFQVQVLKEGEIVQRRRASADATSRRLWGFEPGVSYEVRVYAYNGWGVSASSEPVFVTWPSPPGPVAVADLRADIVGPTSVRLSWTDRSADEQGVRVMARVPGWYRVFETGPNRESYDLNGLAPGGFYRFVVWPYNSAGPGAAVGTTLTLGTVGPAPAEPLNLAWSHLANGVAQLTWSHQTNDEMGFEVQARRPTAGPSDRWTRVSLLPAGAERFELETGEDLDYRVFAYNAQAFSKSSNTVRGRPVRGGAGTSELTAAPVGATGAILVWTDPWTNAALGVLEVDARRPGQGWTQLATAEAVAGRIVVTGLDADTPYTFRLRADDPQGGTLESVHASLLTDVAVGACRQTSEYLCLGDGRFEVRTHWSNPDALGHHGVGRAADFEDSDESGLFWFFEPENVELIVKVLDGRAINGSYWVFFGALTDLEYWIGVRDTATGERKTYYNSPKNVCGQKDLVAFGELAGASGELAGSGGDARLAPGLELIPAALSVIRTAANVSRGESTGSCQPTADRVCLLNGRFEVAASFIDPNRRPPGPEVARALTSLTGPRTGYFWFFDPSNIELAVKALDGRALNGAYWFLYGGLSDVEYEVTFTDTVSGRAKTYRNEPGSICGNVDADPF